MTDSPELTISRDGGRVVIIGDVRTHADRESLKDTIAAAIADPAALNPGPIVIDVSHATYLDGYGLQSIVTAARKLAEVGAVLMIDGANEDLLALLRITKIDQVLVIIAHRAKKPATPEAA